MDAELVEARRTARGLLICTEIVLKHRDDHLGRDVGIASECECDTQIKTSVAVLPRFLLFLASSLLPTWAT